MPRFEWAPAAPKTQAPSPSPSTPLPRTRRVFEANIENQTPVGPMVLHVILRSGQVEHVEFSVEAWAERVKDKENVATMWPHLRDRCLTPAELQAQAEKGAL
jgi:hypothetical protein